MGNALRCLEGGGEDGHAGAGDRYPYYRPTSGFRSLELQARDPDAPSPPPAYRRVPAQHDVAAAAAAVAALDHQYNIDFNKPTSMLDAPTFIVQHSGSFELGSTVVLPPCPRKTYQDQDIDESSAAGLCDAVSYARTHPMLIQVPVLGASGKKFWRLSDEATRISRNLALILWSHHLAGKHLAAPLQLSSVWVSSSGRSVKLRGVRFSRTRFSPKRVRNDYRDLARVLQALVRVSGGDVAKLPPDYTAFLAMLVSDAVDDEFFIVNHPALLPMSNRTEAFLVLYDRLVTTLGRTPAGRKKKKRILAQLPYEQDWLDTARANTEIKKYVVGVQNQYKRTQPDQLRLNRNVRSHLHQYSDEDIEQVLYCEWPVLLAEMARMLHAEGELQSTGIHTKFG